MNKDKGWLGMKIYVASSWRNPIYDNILIYLRINGLDHYNFKNGNSAFHWREIDESWENWTKPEMIRALESNVAKKAFEMDFTAMNECDALLLVQPCGRSAHLEAGYFAGQGKPVVILADNGDPELMFKLADKVVKDTKEAILFFQGCGNRPINPVNPVKGFD